MCAVSRPHHAYRCVIHCWEAHHDRLRLGRKSVPLVGIGNTSCSKCGEVRPFRLLLSYNYMHLYWIFGAVLRRRYLVACSVCSQGFWVDK